MAELQHEGGLVPAQDRDTSFPRGVVRRKPVPRRTTDATGHQLLLPSERETHEHEEHGLSNEEGSEDWRDSGNTWQPSWIQKGTLCLFVAIFAGMTASLISLWALDRSRNGFHVNPGSNQFALTYAPTAVLVIIISMWRQLDYQCKTLQPWRELCNGPVAADRSMMLDYISPLQVTSLVRAIRYRHPAVIASILGFALLKVIVLSSTGLLVITPTRLQGTHPVTLSTSFDGTGFWNSVVLRGFIPNYPLIQRVGGGAVQAYSATQRGGIAVPENIVGPYAIQSFALNSDMDARIVSAEVDVFVPQISCQIATADRVRFNQFTLSSDTCSVGFEGQGLAVLDGEPSRLQSSKPLQVCSDQACENVAFFSWARINCSDTDGRSPSQMVTLNASMTDDLRFALVAGVVTSRKTPDSGDSYATSVDTPLPAAVICKIDYSLSRANVTHDLRSDSFTVGDLTEDHHLDGLTGIMLGEILYTALYETINVEHNTSFLGEQSLQTVLLQTLDGEQSLQRLQSSETLQQAAISSFSGMATHFMQQSYLTTSNAQVNARVEYTDDRLRIGLTSMRIMTAGFLLLLLCTLGIMLTTPSIEVPRDVDTLAARTMVLRFSPSLQDVLRHMGKLRTSQLTTLLAECNFWIEPGRQFEIKTTLPPLALSLRASELKKRTWAPLPARYPLASLAFLLPLVAIVVLEVLNRISLAKEGILDVTANENTATIVSRYTTALVALLIATCYNSFDFVVSSFAPFSLLRRGGVPATRFIDLHPLASVPPVAIMQSLKGRDFASVLSNLAAMTGSVLAVIASGLSFVDRASILDLPVVATSNRWNVAWNGSSGDGGAVALLDQMQHGIATTPPTIWNSTVIPLIEDTRLLVGDPTAEQESHNYTISVKGIRPELICDIVSDDNITISIDDKDYIQVQATPMLPPNCQHGGQHGTDKFFNYSTEFNPSKLPSYMGDLMDLRLGPWTESSYVYSQGERGLVQEDWINPAGCPSIGVIFVETKGSNTTSKEVTALLCSQKLELVNLHSSYSGNDSHGPLIDMRTPPVLMHGPKIYLTNGTDGIDTFPWRVRKYLESNLTVFPEYIPIEDVATPDNFFHHVFYGPEGTAPKDLAGSANQGTLIQAVQKLYNKYMCLVINMKFREPISHDGATADSSNLVHGTMRLQRSRLKINATSKLTLQIMLAFMTTLGLGAWCLTNLRGTLPRNPCSIASSMALLAGSDLCDGPDPLIPANALSMSKQKQHELFSGWMFSLGWWRRTKKPSSSVPAIDEAESSETLLAKQESEEWRFGIDVGMPERLGFRERTWGRRKKPKA